MLNYYNVVTGIIRAFQVLLKEVVKVATPTFTKNNNIVKSSFKDQRLNSTITKSLSDSFSVKDLSLIRNTLIENTPWTKNSNTDINPEDYYFTIGLQYNLKYNDVFQNDTKTDHWSSANFDDDLNSPIKNSDIKCAMYSKLLIYNGQYNNDNFNVVTYWSGHGSIWSGIKSRHPKNVGVQIIKNLKANSLKGNNKKYDYSSLLNLRNIAFNLSANVSCSAKHITPNGNSKSQQKYEIGFQNLSVLINSFHFQWHHI